MNARNAPMPVGADGARRVLTNAMVVTPDRVLDRGTVVVEGGVITDVCDRTYARGTDTWDLEGRFLLPGFVDLHNDDLEREIRPQPRGDGFAPDVILAQYDRRLSAAGITTQFHGISFTQHPTDGRNLTDAMRYCRAVQHLHDAPYATIDHRILYRLELRAPGALEALWSVCSGTEPLISVALHTVGQQQHFDLETLYPLLPPSGPTEVAARETTATTRQSEAMDNEEATIVNTLRRVIDIGMQYGMLLMSHDDDTVERVDMMADLGFRVAEFPTTVAAAQHAHQRGMLVSVGAPNVLRGSSAYGMVSARELLARGLVDVMVADYHAPTLLAAVFTVVDKGLATLPAAVRLVTCHPASVSGLTDRGRLVPHYRADMLVVSRYGKVPVVDITFVAGIVRHISFAHASSQIGLELTRFGGSSVELMKRRKGLG